MGGEAGEVLSPLIARLWPLLSIILQAEAAPLVGAGFMRVGPGAAGQELHKDVHGHDRHGGVAARGAEAGEAGEGGEGGEGAAETCGRDGCPLKPWHTGMCMPSSAAEGAAGGEAADGGRRSSRRAASIEA